MKTGQCQDGDRQCQDVLVRCQDGDRKMSGKTQDNMRMETGQYEDEDRTM